MIIIIIITAVAAAYPVECSHECLQNLFTAAAETFVSSGYIADKQFPDWLLIQDVQR